MESALYGIYARVVDVSETSEHSERVRFLIQKQRVRKYRTPALSMKYSLFLFLSCFILFIISVSEILAEMLL